MGTRQVQHTLKADYTHQKKPEECYQFLVGTWKQECFLIKPKSHSIFSIGGFEWISINLLKSVAFSLQTSENNLKSP